MVTTDSSTLYCGKNKSPRCGGWNFTSRRQGRQLLGFVCPRQLLLGWLLLAVILAALAPASARAELAPTEITSLRVERADDGLYLSATLKFDLPSVVEEALLKGIPVSFVSEAQVLRDRWYWYDKRVATATRNVRLAYQPLTRRWRVGISSGTVTSAGSGVALSQNFDSLAEAMAVVQRIGKWKIAEPSDVETDARHNIDFRFRLDLTQLPRPFQIGALGQNDWSINAERNIRPEAAR